MEAVSVARPFRGGRRREAHQRLLHVGELARGRVVLPELLAPDPADGIVCPRDAVDELLAVARWIDANAASVRVLDVSGTFASPARPLPRYPAPARRPAGAGPTS